MVFLPLLSGLNVNVSLILPYLQCRVCSAFRQSAVLTSVSEKGPQKYLELAKSQQSLIMESHSSDPSNQCNTEQ